MMSDDNKIDSNLVMELLSTLRHSSLNTVVVEGSDDVIFYRKIEDDLSGVISILPAGNKATVLELKNKIDNLSNQLSIKVAFIVDKDTWINFGMPTNINCNNLICTNGYSIENDCFQDGNLYDLMEKKEKALFDYEKELFIKWYALALDRNHSGRVDEEGKEYSYRLHPTEVIEKQLYQIKLLNGEVYPNLLYQDIFDNYELKLRGKSLMQLLMRRLSDKHRRIKYSKNILMEMSISRRSDNYKRILKKIHDIFMLKNHN